MVGDGDEGFFDNLEVKRSRNRKRKRSIRKKPDVNLSRRRNTMLNEEDKKRVINYLLAQVTQLRAVELRLESAVRMLNGGEPMAAAGPVGPDEHRDKNPA
jgi:hypothetical protein